LIRKDGAQKPTNFGRPEQSVMHLPRGDLGRGARIAAGPRRRSATYGPKALAGFGSAKGSNEEAYLFQKLVRTGFGSNNVDHCTRLCHASSVAALLEGIGSGACQQPVRRCVTKDAVVIVIGANPTVNHPVAATFIKNAVKRNGAKLIVMDPRRSELGAHASSTCSSSPAPMWRCSTR
jgi:formate dehydrogenase major subunit